MNPDPARLKEEVILVLEKQGYLIQDGRIQYPEDATKEDLRRMNGLAVDHSIATAEPALRGKEEHLLSYIANGDEVIPERVQPSLVPVVGQSEEALLFRYASLHWSIPVSTGYGRRMRFLVIDESNGKLIGIIGLGDPVYAIRHRDDFIGWDSDMKKRKLYHVMDAFVLGAVPPYSTLLCGKLIALLTLSNEVRGVFRQRYSNKKTLISGEIRKPWLALVTTTSALGRSSIYNRIKLDGYEYWRSLGFTQGSGEFHFSNGVYQKLRAFAEANSQPTAKKSAWGKGFRSKREVVKKCLPLIGLSTKE